MHGLKKRIAGFSIGRDQYCPAVAERPMKGIYQPLCTPVGTQAYSFGLEFSFLTNQFFLINILDKGLEHI